MFCLQNTQKGHSITKVIPLKPSSYRTKVQIFTKHTSIRLGRGSMASEGVAIEPPALSILFTKCKEGAREAEASPSLMPPTPSVMREAVASPSVMPPRAKKNATQKMVCKREHL